MQRWIVSTGLRPQPAPEPLPPRKAWSSGLEFNSEVVNLKQRRADYITFSCREPPSGLASVSVVSAWRQNSAKKNCQNLRSIKEGLGPRALCWVILGVAPRGGHHVLAPGCNGTTADH